jgi:DNA-binding transcriptional ArsR family regulator
MTAITSIDDPRFVKAMSHPLRVRILAMLDERTASPNQLAGWLGASLGSVAYHVRTLLELGLIELVDETRVRGAVEHHYRAKARPQWAGKGWAEASPVAKQAAVGSSLEVIGEYARLSAAAGGFDRSDAQLRRAILKLDGRGFTQLSEACEKLLERVERIEAEAAARIGRDPHAEGIVEAGLGVLLFEAARLSAQEGGGAGTGPGRGLRAPRPRRRRSAPATGSVVAGASTEGLRTVRRARYTGTDQNA